jgi:hypothetical protein
MPQKPPGIPVTQAARVATFARFHLRKPVAIFEPTSLAFAVWLILGGVDGAGARTQNVQIAAPLRLSKKWLGYPKNTQRNRSVTVLG